jgi:hypothetical protein
VSSGVNLFDLLSDQVAWWCDDCPRCERPLPDMRDPNCEDEIAMRLFRGPDKIMIIGYHLDCWYEHERVARTLSKIAG